ncbi:hypothetical protein BBJ28_00021946 [Nothophytophthora sp. Chile5]|nr:hypothetical protein BBJ28_00021946 [Nothophytophthora sp. Chile5]
MARPNLSVGPLARLLPHCCVQDRPRPVRITRPSLRPLAIGSEAMEAASPALSQIASSLTEAINEINPTTTAALDAELRQNSLPPSVGGAILPSTSLVQVAPLPLTTEFHAAKVLELGAMPPAPTQQHEEAYIPVALARAQLSKVVADMHAMKAEQVEKLGEILARYRGIEQDTRLRHEAHIRALKDRAETRLREAAERFEALEDAQQQREVLHSQEKQLLLDEQEQQRQTYVKAHEVWRCEFECALSAHEDETARAQTMALNEIARVSRAAEVSGHRVQQQLRDELEMSGEDARGQAMRVRDQLHQARTALQTQHRAFLDRAAKLQRFFEAERQTERCLRELIDTVVERDRQEAEVKYTRRLQAQLRTLEAKAKAAGSREEVLERRLEAARDRFERMEAQAIRETVELLVQAVVVTFQPPPRESVPVPQAVPKSQESRKEQDDLDRVRTTETVSDLSLKAMYESEVERSRERDGVVLRSKISLHEAKEKLEELAKSKKAAKSAVKSWLAAFQAQHDREPAIEEKAQAKDKYLAFKQAEEAWSRHKADVSALKQQHRELVLRVEASSRWSALGSVTVKSPRPQFHPEEPDAEGRSSPRESRSASNSEKSSRASSRPPSTRFPIGDNSADATATDAQSGVVAALEQEVQHLRQQLASANAVPELKRTRGDELVASEASAIEESPAAALMTKSSLSIEDGVVSTATDGEQEVLAAASSQAEDRMEADEAEALKLAEPEGVDDAREVRDQQMQHQRETLQAEITELTREIDARRAEKTRLELEIEQLRLHLELSEDQDSRELESLPPSEAKVSVETDLEADEATISGHDEDFHDESDVIEEQREQQDDNESLAIEDEVEASTAEPKDVEAEEQEDEQEEVEELDEDEDQEVKEDAARSLQLRTMVEEAVARGKTQFNRGDKTRCYQTYVKCAEQCITELQQLHDRRRREEAAAVKRVLAESARLPAARGPLVLRKQLDVIVESCEQWLNAREEQAAARQAERLVQKEAKASAKAVAVAVKQQQQLEKKQNKAEQEEERKPHTKKTAPPAQSTGSAAAVGGGKALEEVKQKLRALESKAKVDRVKISQLEAALAKAETQLASGGGGGGGGNASGGAGSAALERRVADMEKKNKKALDESEKAAKKEISALFQQLQAAQRTSQELQDQATVLQKELGIVGGKAKQLGQLEVEVGELREQAALVAPLTSELRESRTQFATLETSYREEQALRKKYYNQIEDMKGKIRVYARCRPMSGSEIDRGCATCLKFLDEFSLEVNGGARGNKTFAYDQVFTQASTQVQVFEDTKNLLQSALDGYNVCIFAYGQTGSGKTFTMTGSESDPGLSPRAIHHLFALATEAQANFTVSFQATMLELYNDTLIDLFHLVDGGAAHDTKLEIKKNDKGMVVVQNATMKKCTSPEQTLKLFEAANKKRQVGATKMNAESSRSHSVFSLLVESFNKTTKATTVGKLSLVDLAGSERAGKTGATADRLKEAQAINKSLSAATHSVLWRWAFALTAALGDVISALSTNEKFIPYRNNKVTNHLASAHSLRGCGLRLPQEETGTSLTYASRVKLITNNANKNSESEQVNRLKAIIKQLRAGKADVDLDGILD